MAAARAPEPSLRTRLVIENLGRVVVVGHGHDAVAVGEVEGIAGRQFIEGMSLRLPSMSDSERVASAVPTWLPAKVVALIS